MKQIQMLGVGKGVFGYTIVEALIFLAVSGMLLVSVAGLISGRQDRQMFANAVNDVQQNLLDMFNDVSDGYYPSDSKVICDVTGSAESSVVSLNSGAGDNESGTNSKCMFIGKAIEFDGSSFAAYTMVAPSNMDGGITGSNLSRIKLAGKGTNAGLSDAKSNNLDLQTKKIFTTSASGDREYKALIVTSDLGRGMVTNNFSGNANKLTLYGSTVNLPTNGSMPVDISSVVPINSNVTLCLAQTGGGDKKSAYLTITPQLTIDRIIASRGDGCPVNS